RNGPYRLPRRRTNSRPPAGNRKREYSLAASFPSHIERRAAGAWKHTRNIFGDHRPDAACHSTRGGFRSPPGPPRHHFFGQPGTWFSLPAGRSEPALIFISFRKANGSAILECHPVPADTWAGSTADYLRSRPVHRGAQTVGTDLTKDIDFGEFLCFP